LQRELVRFVTPLLKFLGEGSLLHLSHLMVSTVFCSPDLPKRSRAEGRKI